jgi:hypothetical protein
MKRSSPPRGASCRRGRPDGARVIQLRGELVPAAHFETLADEPEMLREGLEGARLVPQLELVNLVGVAVPNSNDSAIRKEPTVAKTAVSQSKGIAMKTMLAFFGRAVQELVAFVFFFGFLGGIAAIAQRSVITVSKFHWVAGVVVGALWLALDLALWLLIWYAAHPSAPKWLTGYMFISKKTGNAGLAEQYPVASMMALLGATILVAVFVMTNVSALLESHHLLRYAATNPRGLPMTELLFRLYMWHTIDMIPLIDGLRDDLR